LGAKITARGFNLTLVLTPLLGLDDGWAFARHSWIEPNHRAKQANDQPTNEQADERTTSERSQSEGRLVNFKSCGANADTPLITGAVGF